MLTLFITTNLLAFTYAGDTFWDATNGECGSFDANASAPAIFIRDSGRCGVCPSSTCHTIGDATFSPRCFSLRDPLTDATANQALIAKCFDRANNPACDVSSPSDQYFEWDTFPKNCRVFYNSNTVNTNGCPKCVDSNTLCVLGTTPIFVVQTVPSGTGGLCYITGCNDPGTNPNRRREFHQFQYQSGVPMSSSNLYNSAKAAHWIRDRCPALDNCIDPEQWIMDVCGECPYCHVPTTTAAGSHTTTAGQHTTSGSVPTTIYIQHTTNSGQHTTRNDPHTTSGGQHTTNSNPHTTKTDTHTTSNTNSHSTRHTYTTSGDQSTTIANDDICIPGDDHNCNDRAINCHMDYKHNSAYNLLSDQEKDNLCAHCLCDVAFGDGNGHASYRCMYHALTVVGFNQTKNDNTLAERLKTWFVETCFSNVANCQFADIEIVSMTGCNCGSFSCNGEVGVFDQGSANKYGYGIGLVMSFLLYIIA